MKKALTLFGKALLWFTWLYPFLRVFVILPIAYLEEYIGEKTTKTLMGAAKVFHGGSAVTEIVTSIYMIYFVLSVAAYLYWHFRKKIRIGWFQRLALFLVTFYNFFNIYLMHMVENDRMIK